MKFGYQSEKFATARRALMLPHSRGEHSSIADAFHECSLGLHGLDRTALDDDSRRWLDSLERLMDTTGLSDPNGEGLWTVKARTLTVDDKLELSRIVDELAFWFRRDERT